MRTIFKVWQVALRLINLWQEKLAVLFFDVFSIERLVKIIGNSRIVSHFHLRNRTRVRRRLQ